MKLHLIAPFHTIPTRSFSHCAFTGKALRFPRMMQPRGFKVVEYANEGSEAGADEQAIMLSTSEFQKYFPPQDPQAFVGDRAIVNSPGWLVFNNRLERELRKRVRPGDLICHPFGHAHRAVVDILPSVAHVETGIGYPDSPFGCYRIFESRAWQHWHFGKHGEGRELELSWVVPNYFDTTPWKLRDPNAPPSEHSPYVLMLGRVNEIKGTRTFVELAREWRETYPRSPLRFLIAGQGDLSLFDVEGRGDVQMLGSVSGEQRFELVRNAEAVVAPSRFVEPFGGAVVEGLLCGVPALVPAYGGFTETIEDRINGVHVADGNWLSGLGRAMALGAKPEQRQGIQSMAQMRYSLEACGGLYERIFDTILKHWGYGGTLTPAMAEGGATGPRPAFADPPLDAPAGA